MIELVTDWASLVNAAGGVAMAAFGVWVLTLTPRTRSTKWLGLFAIAGGLHYVPTNLLDATGWEMFALVGPVVGGTHAVAGLALLGLTYEVVASDGDVDRWLWRGALAVMSAFVLIPYGFAAFHGEFGALNGWRALSFWGFFGGRAAFFGGYAALLLVLALRYRRPPQEREGTVRQHAFVLTVALMPWIGLSAGTQLVALSNPSISLSDLVIPCRCNGWPIASQRRRCQAAREPTGLDRRMSDATGRPWRWR